MIRVVLVLLVFLNLGCDPKPADNLLVPKANKQFNQDNRDRSAWQKPSLVINKLGDLSGKTIADIGAGTGYFAFRLAFKAEKVIAVEIDESLIDLMEGIKVNLPAEMQKHFQTRLATLDNAQLKKEEVDVIVVINTITYIEEKAAYLKSLYDGLKAGGKIFVLDYKDISIPLDDIPKQSERLSTDDLAQALTRAGFKEVDIDIESLDYQYMVTANKR